MAAPVLTPIPGQSAIEGQTLTFGVSATADVGFPTINAMGPTGTTVINNGDGTAQVSVPFGSGSATESVSNFIGPDVTSWDSSVGMTPALAGVGDYSNIYELAETTADVAHYVVDVFPNIPDGSEQLAGIVVRRKPGASIDRNVRIRIRNSVYTIYECDVSLDSGLVLSQLPGLLGVRVDQLFDGWWSITLRFLEGTIGNYDSYLIVRAMQVPRKQSFTGSNEVTLEVQNPSYEPRQGSRDQISYGGYPHSVTVWAVDGAGAESQAQVVPISVSEPILLLGQGIVSSVVQSVVL